MSSVNENANRSRLRWSDISPSEGRTSCPPPGRMHQVRRKPDPTCVTREVARPVESVYRELFCQAQNFREGDLSRATAGNRHVWKHLGKSQVKVSPDACA